MEKPFFSVIVPCHNAAGRMRKGLGSIKRQTFTDYELIIICDDCQDDTAKIALGYGDKVRTVDWHNCGKSRNAGLELAEGKYVLFMDDDDWWTDDSAFMIIAQELKRLEREGEPFDVLAFNFIFGESGLARQYPGHLYIAIWNKAWSREFIGETRFPEVPHSDDVGFAEQTHHRARFKYLNEALYYYDWMRPGSITQKLHTGELKTLEEMGLR